ncbi:hypothetical protein [Verrucomicrobium sp. 3C]|uniref:hypothetical protein n=1 Tax=Verrucomicrobium sp. 3C TaxID=1134055 RepID=UPI00035E2178|nr:hypothetical protein [Verrucomicrobium sp. 3C]
MKSTLEAALAALPKGTEALLGCCASCAEASWSVRASGFPLPLAGDGVPDLPGYPPWILTCYCQAYMRNVTSYFCDQQSGLVLAHHDENEVVMLCDSWKDDGEEADALTRENERLSSAIAEVEERLAEAAEQKAASEGKAAQLSEELAAAQAEIGRERAAAAAARVELAKSQLGLESLPKLEADLLTVRAALDEKRQVRIQAEQEAAVLRERAAQIEQRLGDMLAERERRNGAETGQQPRPQLEEKAEAR